MTEVKKENGSLDLVLVMPVYNEEACIRLTVESWLRTLSHLQLRFRILILNDGSTDGTQDQLNVFGDNPSVEIVVKENSGHGPTIWRGYQRAVDMAPWVFQCDSDDEMKAHSFFHLWRKRMGYDILLGVRRYRDRGLVRRAVSLMARFCVLCFFGREIKDVNIPYRLMRADILKGVIARIPQGTFAPNVLVTGIFSQRASRIYQCVIPHYPRTLGKSSLTGIKVLFCAVRSFVQIVCFRFRLGNFRAMRFRASE